MLIKYKESIAFKIRSTHAFSQSIKFKKATITTTTRKKFKTVKTDDSS